MGSSDPTVYDPSSGSSGGPDYNYPFTGSNAAGNANLLIYTGRITPAPTGYSGADTSFLHGQAPLHQAVGPPSTGSRPYTPSFWERVGNPLGIGQPKTQPYTEPGKGYAVSSGQGVGQPTVIGGAGGKPNYERVTLNQFVSSFANYASDQMQQLQARLVAAGALSPTGYVKGLYDQSTARAVYQVALAVSSRNDPLFTFDVALGQAIRYNAQQNAANTTTTTNYDISSPDHAKALVLTEMQQLLHRDPTPQEYSAFVGQLTAYEKAHPQVVSTTSTNQIDPTTGGATVKSRTATGGVTEADRQYQALQTARGAPDYHAVQALNFLGVLEDLAHAPNDVGTSTKGV